MTEQFGRAGLPEGGHIPDEARRQPEVAERMQLVIRSADNNQQALIGTSGINALRPCRPKAFQASSL